MDPRRNALAPNGRPVKQHWEITVERIEKYLSTIYFTDCNLMSILEPLPSVPLSTILVASVPPRVSDGRDPRWTFSEAMDELGSPLDLSLESGDADSKQWKACSIGDRFGPSWSTHWFCITARIPAIYRKHRVVLRWDSSSEALLYDVSGLPLQMFNGSDGCDRRTDFVLFEDFQPVGDSNEEVAFFVEMACNGAFGCGDGDQIRPPNPNRMFELRIASITAIEPGVHQLYTSLQVALQIAKSLGKESIRGCDALMAANAAVNVIHLNDMNTISSAQCILDSFFACTNANTQHRISCVGHCHIDTAWLWPYAETRRKCIRSWATQIALMDRFPEYKFVCSQAIQFEWVLADAPRLFDRIKEKVLSGQFIPVGGSYVEMDGNLPCGESLVRQFMYGQRFYLDQFGLHCKEFWLPDTFGYTPQIPQIVRKCGMDYFVTQKLSWNNINKFPHSTFWWEGLDGSRVLTHFPPADTYTAQATADQTIFSVKNFRDKDRSRNSLYVFGHGDGGGGPTREMLERIELMKNVDGIPTMEYNKPVDFFSTLERSGEASQFLTWVGELYFELHRGTYTSQAQSKLWNRRCEGLLRELEHLSTCLRIRTSKNWEELSSSLRISNQEIMFLWKEVLLNQFHDVLPGSSIEMVYEDVHRLYAHVRDECDTRIRNVLSSLLEDLCEIDQDERLFLFNSLSFDRQEVLELNLDDDSIPSVMNDHVQQRAYNSNHPLVLVSCPSHSVSSVQLSEISNVKPESHLVTGQRIGQHYVLENQYLLASIHVESGLIVSLIEKSSGYDCIDSKCTGANQFMLYEDIPLYWDAWDTEIYRDEKPLSMEGPVLVELEEQGPLRATIRISRRISDRSMLTQKIFVDCANPLLQFDLSVQWFENRKMLRVDFPLSIRSDVASYEVPYGVCERPTHENTSWDFAKFEVCGHRFADISEADFGVALLNDCKYGHSCRRNVLSLSLLKSPKAPDANCDMGDHRIRYALFPHSHLLRQCPEVVYRALAFNAPLLHVVDRKKFMVSNPDTQCPNSESIDFVRASHPRIIIDCVKLGESSNSDVILRAYESLGGRAQSRVEIILPASITSITVQECSMLEEDIGESFRTIECRNGVTVCVSWDVLFSPFEVKTFRVHFQ